MYIYKRIDIIDMYTPVLMSPGLRPKMQSDGYRLALSRTIASFTTTVAACCGICEYVWHKRKVVRVDPTLFLFSPVYGYSILEYVQVPVEHRVHWAEYVILLV